MVAGIIGVAVEGEMGDAFGKEGRDLGKKYL